MITRTSKLNYFHRYFWRPKVTKTDEGAHGYQKQLESVTLRPI